MNMKDSYVLVTGGAGYVGSHTVISLIQAGYTPVIVDNLSNSSRRSIKAVEKITRESIRFHEVNLLDKQQLRAIFQKYVFSAVLHFAGMKAVGESVDIPFMYYQNNVIATLNLIECLCEHGVKSVVFSSSCTVYGNAEYLPIDEQHPAGNCTNPYGRTKYFIEQIFTDLCAAHKDWNVVILRYFNPVGAHPSGLLGEDPVGIPNQLMPHIAQVAVGRRSRVTVYGNNYNTPDGTGVRDYIHVMDLARGHVHALQKLEQRCGLKVYNLGTGTGYSVLQMIDAFQKVSGKKIPYEIKGRRSGDAEQVYADPRLAETELSWKCQFGLQQMCEDLWRWQSKNPYGYEQ